ncbi:MAG: dicarboxylate/amino acid:cation symporter [Flavobacteriales bacterium]|nr:dicarboxylate/amino acid:cation symporter [Flavobacteriales bacterium]
MKKVPLHWQVIIALILGTFYALLSVNMGWNEFTLDYIDPFGKIFINILKLIAVPLVLFSIISGVSALGDVTKLGKIGIKTLLLYVGTTMIAVTIGLIAVNTLKPGDKVSEDLLIDNRIAYELWTNDNDIERLDAICYSCDEAYADRVAIVSQRPSDDGANDWVNDKLTKADRTKESRPLQPVVDIVPSNIIRAMFDMEMLQVIFFAIFFGIVLVMLPREKAQPVMDFIDGVNEVFIKMVDVVMKAMPFFVFCLLAGAVVSAAGDDPSKLAELLSFLLWYSIAVILGLAFMIFIFYPGLTSLIVKKINYGFFMKGISKAQLTAFSTSSSVATLPVTLNCVENNIGVSKRTTSFVLPIGATVNMDGTSLYQAVAVVALAQFHMVDLSLLQQLTIVFTATLASIGAAAVPSAGLVLMIIVLESVGLNPAWIALIFPVDRILDMCRTVVNVTGDASVSTIVAHSEGELNIPEAAVQE